MSDAALFDIHGVTVAICGAAQASSDLAEHFAAFAVRADRPPQITIDLRLEAPELQRALPGRLRAAQIVPRGVVYNAGHRTWVDHQGQALSCYDYLQERGWISSLSPDLLQELGYLMIHSRLGVFLERRGLTRLHALGVAVDERALLVLGPSGAGKSSLAMALLQDGRVRLLGDDMVLIDRRGFAWQFASPLGVGSAADGANLGTARPFVRHLHPPKWVIPLTGALGARVQHQPVPVALLVSLQRASSPPSRLVSSSRRSFAPVLWRDMVVGLGLPQVLELVARWGWRDLGRQAPSALQRAAHAAGLLRRARTMELEASDLQESARTLLEALSI